MAGTECENSRSEHIQLSFAHNTYGKNNSYHYHYSCNFGYRVKGDLSYEITCIDKGDGVEWRDLNDREIAMPTCILDMRLVTGLGVGGPLLLIIILIAVLWRRERQKRIRERRARSKRMSSIKPASYEVDNPYARAPLGPGAANPVFQPGPPPMVVHSAGQSHSPRMSYVDEADPYLMPGESDKISNRPESIFTPNAAEIVSTSHARESITSLATANTDHDNDDYALPADLIREEMEEEDSDENPISISLDVPKHECIPPPTIEDVAHVPEQTIEHQVKMSSFNPATETRERKMSVLLVDERTGGNNQSEL